MMLEPNIFIFIFRNDAIFISILGDKEIGTQPYPLHKFSFDYKSEGMLG